MLFFKINSKQLELWLHPMLPTFQYPIRDVMSSDMFSVVVLTGSSWWIFCSIYHLNSKTWNWPSGGDASGISDQDQCSWLLHTILDRCLWSQSLRIYVHPLCCPWTEAMQTSPQFQKWDVPIVYHSNTDNEYHLVHTHTHTHTRCQSYKGLNISMI